MADQAGRRPAGWPLRRLPAASLALGILGLTAFSFYGIVPALALVSGLLSDYRIHRTGGHRGRGMAEAGIVLGIIGILATLSLVASVDVTRFWGGHGI
jgi:hypothetical protein